MRTRCAAVALALAGALLAGCGGSGPGETGAEAVPKAKAEPGSSEPAEVWVTLDGRAGAADVGLLLAEERGYFEDVGLSVGMAAPTEPGRPVSYVIEHTADLGVSQLPQVALAREKGAPVSAVGSLVREPTLALIWLKRSGVRRLADLKGRTIAVAGIPYQRQILGFLLARAGLTVDDVDVEVVGYDLLPALVRGRADAIVGSWNVEGAVLEARGIESTVTRVRDLGVPAYDEVVVIARTRRASQNPRLIRRFMAAVERGARAAIEDPEAAARAIEKSPEGGNVLSRKAIRATVAATLPILSHGGDLIQGRAERLSEWMQELSSRTH